MTLPAGSVTLLARRSHAQGRPHRLDDGAPHQVNLDAFTGVLTGKKYHEALQIGYRLVVDSNDHVAVSESGRFGRASRDGSLYAYTHTGIGEIGNDAEVGALTAR